MRSASRLTPVLEPRSTVARAKLRSVLTGLVIVPAVLLCGTSPVLAQQQRVTGTVTAAAGGQPLPGVQVSVKGTAVGTLTSGDGRYALTAPSPQDTLVFTSIGYAQQEVGIDGRSVVDATLVEQAVPLQQIVVTGYGTQRKRDVTGAISSIQGEKVSRVPTTSVTKALQGQVAGVQVTPASGEPGSEAVVRIRGTGTLNNASPLYVVDGMLLDDISFLSPNDVASIEVLKDASATAIYGSRGANGVIIVTTKKGSASRATQWTANAYVGTQSVLHPIDLVNAQQYATLANELAANQNLPPYFANPSSVGAGTDWQDAVFQTAPMQNYQITASGGSDKVTYYFSTNYIDQEGVLPRSPFRRLTVRLNNDYQLAEHVKLGHNLNFSYTDDKRAPGVLGMLYRADPTVAPRDENGDFSDANLRSSAGNPAAAVFYTHNKENGGRLVGNVFADFDFLRHFDFRSSFGLDYDRSDLRTFVPTYVVSATQQNQISGLTVETGNSHSWLWENTLTYNYNVGDNRLSLLGGVTAQAFYTELLGGQRSNIVGTTSNLWYLDAGDAEGQTNFNSASDWKMLSYLFRTNYTYKDRYLFTGSLRVDGSSRFGADNRYGYFPSLAVGWDIAQEPFMQNQNAISALKLRASWGEIGNDKIGAYPGIPVVTGNLNAVLGSDQTLHYGASPIALANPDVKWEKTVQTDVGADMAFMGGRLEASVDYYHRLTDGILVQVPIPLYVGVNEQPFVNAAKVLNRGVEGSLSLTQAIGGLQLTLGANGSTIHNEVRELGGGKEEIFAGGLGNEIRLTTRTAPGHPIGAFWGYQVVGVLQDANDVASSAILPGEAPGDLKYADLNNDGTITTADMTYIGSPIPDFIYGLNARAAWHGFDLSAVFAGQSGNEVFNGKKAVRFGVENFETSFLQRWNGAGTSDTEPRVTNAGVNYQSSTRFIEDGSYFKLQTAELGYQLPESLTSPLGVQTARLYVAGSDLFMVTDYSGYSPEVTNSSDPNSVIAAGIDLGIYPPARTITVGLNVSF